MRFATCDRAEAAPGEFLDSWALGLIMRFVMHRSRPRDPTRGTTFSSSSAADELRLFPGGKQYAHLSFWSQRGANWRSRQDPDGVRVVPGQTFSKKPVSLCSDIQVFAFLR